MHQRHFGRKVGAGASCALALLLCAAPSFAKEAAKESKRAACTPALAAYKAGQESEKGRHWLEARDHYAVCVGATACGGLVPKCQARADKLASSMPSVVPVATDARGNPRVDVEVRVDGRLLTSRLDGTSLPVDGGLHEFTYSANQAVFASQKVLIVETQRNRILTVAVESSGPKASSTPAVLSAATEVKPATPSANASADAAPEPEAAPRPNTGGPEPTTGTSSRWSLPRSPLPYVVGGAGVLAVASGVLLTIWGNNDNASLRSQCSPYCTPSSLDHVRSLYLGADISYGVGAAALAVTTFLFATSRTRESAPEPPAHSLAVDFHPTRTGAVASVSGAF